MGQGAFGSNGNSKGLAGLDGLSFAESLDVLRLARKAFSGMCRIVTEESGIKAVPSFAPDQADWCGASASEDCEDWSIRIGFDGCSSYRIVGTYAELCGEWLKGPESFHSWVGHAVLGAASKVVDGDGEGDVHEVVAGAGDDAVATGLTEPSARAVFEARAGLSACGYLVSPASIPGYMMACSFVAWQGDTLVFVSVTDDDDVARRSERLRQDVTEWLKTSDRPRDHVRAIVVSVDDGRLSTSDVAI